MPSTCDTVGRVDVQHKPARPVILLVEDEEAVRNVLTRFLRAKGWEVVTAADAREAESIWRVRRDEIALLVTDLMLPNGISGQKLGSLLQEQKPNLEVILTSGYSSELAELAPRSNGRAQFLPKPYRPDELLRRVHHALASASIS